MSGGPHLAGMANTHAHTVAWALAYTCRSLHSLQHFCLFEWVVLHLHTTICAVGFEGEGEGGTPFKEISCHHRSLISEDCVCVTQVSNPWGPGQQSGDTVESHELSEECALVKTFLREADTKTVERREIQQKKSAQGIHCLLLCPCACVGSH